MKITDLELKTSNINEMKLFYNQVLELPLLNQTKESISVASGETVLAFQLSEDCSRYHFAFNIPNNKLDKAFLWLSQK